MSSTQPDPLLRSTVRTTVAMVSAAAVFLTALSLVLGLALAAPRSGVGATTSADGNDGRTTTTDTKASPKSNAPPAKAQKPPAEI